MASNKKNGLTCVLFHDKDEGEYFGKLLAFQFLKDFLNEYSEDTFLGRTFNSNTYSAFSSKLFAVVDHSLETFLTEFQKKQCCQCVLFLQEESEPIVVGNVIDQYAFVANLQIIIQQAAEVMLRLKDCFRELFLCMGRQFLKIITISEGSYFVVVCNSSWDLKKLMVSIDEATLCLKKFLNLIYCWSVVS